MRYGSPCFRVLVLWTLGWMLTLAAAAQAPAPGGGGAAEPGKKPAAEPGKKPAAVKKDGKKIPEDPFRVWTSYNGHTVKAEMMELDQGTIVLRGEDGAVMRMRLALLSPADQQFAKERQEALSKAAAADAASPSAKNRLPTFKDGPGKGYFAFISQPTYQARVNASAQVSVQCLDAGKPVGKPIHLRAHYSHYEPARKRSVGRPVVSFDKAPAPTLKPGVLSFEGYLEDDVKFGLNFEFTVNTVQGWGWVEDPPKIAQPTSYGLRYDFSASHAFEPHVKVADQKKVLEPYAVLVRPLSGKTARYPFGDALTSMSGAARLVEFEGPVFGPRKVSVSAPSLKDGRLGPWIYRGYAPYQGFHVGLAKEEKSDRSDKCRIVLTID